MKREKIKLKLEQPHLERIEEMISQIEENTFNIKEVARTTLCSRDLCENDLTYHLIVNQRFDLFLLLLDASKQLYTPELNLIIQSLIKGIIKIKNERNYSVIVQFLKKLRNLSKLQQGSDLQRSIFLIILDYRFQFDIVIYSRFNYTNVLWECKLLEKIYKLLGNNYSLNELDYVQKMRQQIEFNLCLISKKLSRRKLNYLSIGNKQNSYHIYSQICDNSKWDLINAISDDEMFAIAQDGVSPYMKMLQKAPFDFLVKYHISHLKQIQYHIRSQRKKHGYNMLHCIAENRNPVCSEFIEILTKLNVDEFKIEAYFDQIPLAFYIDKQKTLDQSLISYLSNGLFTKSLAQQEGIQIIAQLQAKIIYESLQRKKQYYIPKYKMVKGLNKNKNKQIRSLYKKNRKSPCQEYSDQDQIYQQIVQIHKIFHFRGIKQNFEVSQYSFSNVQLQSLVNIEEPIIVWNKDQNILQQFLLYMENEYGSQISGLHVEIIKSIMEKLKLNLTLEQLILQRKVIILNALVKQYQNFIQIQNLIKDSISRILKKYDDCLTFSFCSYSKEQTFQDYLLCNELINIETYKIEDHCEAFLKLYNLGYRNQKILKQIASGIETQNGETKLSNLLDISLPSNLITVSIEDFREDLFWNQVFQIKLQSSEAGIKILLQEHSKERFYRIQMKKILLQYNPDTYIPLIQGIYDNFDMKEISDLTSIQSNRIILCHIKQDQLKHIFYYQLKGIRVQFNLKLRVDLKTTSIEEEVIIKQINENKSFFSILASNDKYLEFTKEYLKNYQKQEYGEEKMDYIIEALYYEAYQTLELFTDYIKKNHDYYMGQRQYKLILFSFLKRVGSTYFGFSIKQRGRKNKIYPLEFDNLARLVKIDADKLNRQIKKFYSLFVDQIEHLESNNESFFVKSDQQQFLLKQLLYYLDLDSYVVLKKQVIKYINSAPPRTLFNFYKFTKNEEILLKILSDPEVKLPLIDYITPFLFTELSEKIFKAMFTRDYQQNQNNDDKSWRRFTFLYLCEKYSKEQGLSPQVLHDRLLLHNQFNRLIKYFINTNQDEKVQQLLLYASQFKINQQLVPQKSKYFFAFQHTPELGLNSYLFSQFINRKSFFFDEETKQQILINVISNGHWIKLQQILEWIENEQELHHYTNTAISMLLIQYIMLNNNKIDYKTFLIAAPEYHVFSTLSPLSESIHPHDCNLNQIQKNEFYSDRHRTASILYEKLINQISNNSIFRESNQQIQLIFPNTKYLVEDSNTQLLKSIIKLVQNNLCQENWSKYLELIQQNISQYDDNKIDLTFIFNIKIESRIGQFFKQLIDIFIKASKLNNILNQNNVQGSEKYLYRRSQYLYNSNRFDIIKRNRFADILQNHFDGINFQLIEKTERLKQIYYGKPFENQPFKEQDLFIALMSRRKESILKILGLAQDIQYVLTEYQIIQYLIMHGGEQTVLETLQLVKSINKEWFYYQGIPLLTYIVFKKWYKLYAFGEQYLFGQWTAKPNLLKQFTNNNQIELSIHQFATLNQFYVQNRIPFEKQLLVRTCQFLIPNFHNQSHPSYQIYHLLKSIFPYVSPTKIEIFCLQHQQIDRNESVSIQQFFQRHQIDQLMLLKVLQLLSLQKKFLPIGIYSNEDTFLQKQLKSLCNLLEIQCNSDLNNFTVKQLKNLFDLTYHYFGLYHPLIHQIFQNLQNDCIDIRILDNPKLAIFLAQYGDFSKIQPFIEKLAVKQEEQKQISIHLIKIIIMIKYGQNYDNLFDDKMNVHLKYYVEACQLIGQDQNGSITSYFIEQALKILNLKNTTTKTIDYFLNQIPSEVNSVKKAFMLIIKLKEFNYQIESLEHQAIAQVDYLVRKFTFETADGHGFYRLGDENRIQIPLPFEISDYNSFLNNLPQFFKSEYEEAIIKRTTTKKRKFKKTLNIKFEEKNLSHLYNDLRFWINELKSQPDPVYVFDNMRSDQIQGWQDDFDDNAYIYTSMEQDSKFFTQLFYQSPAKLDLRNKYPTENLIFFNNKCLFNQGEIQQLIDEISTPIIDLESFFECFLKRNSLIQQYGSWQQYLHALQCYETFQEITEHILKMVQKMADFFKKGDKYKIKFKYQDFEGTAPKICFLDKYFTFGKCQLIYESQYLVFLLPVSNKPAKEVDLKFLQNILSDKDIDIFIKNYLNLDDEIDALLYLFDLERTLNGTCQTFNKKYNLDLVLEFNKADIKSQIDSLDYSGQVDYLRQLKLYFENTVFIDLQNFIQSNRFSQLQKEYLCSGAIIQKPLKIGYIYNNISLFNRFGLLQTKTQYLKNAKKGEIYHICYISGNQLNVDLCKFIKVYRQKCYVKFMSKGSKKKAISVQKIQSAISYPPHLDPANFQEEKQFVEVLFIDNNGFYYFNRDESFTNKINRTMCLSEFFKETKNQFRLILNVQNVTKNDFYFVAKQFRFKDIYETSFLDDKDYALSSVKKKQDVFRIVPQLSEHVGFQKKKISREINSVQKRQLLLILAEVNFHIEQKEFKIPCQGEILLNKNYEPFLQYCKQMTIEKKDSSKAGEQRQDKIKFFDYTNTLIVKPVEELSLKCYIQHEKFPEIVYWPAIFLEKEYYKFIWTPKIKGLYQLFVNGERTYFQFQVVSSSPVTENYKLENVNSFPYFLETELKFTLYDEFQNLITKLDKQQFNFQVLSKTPDVTVNFRHECKSNYVALYLQLFNYLKQDDSEEECCLEIQLEQKILIQSLKVLVKPRQLTQQRIQAFTQKIAQARTVQLLIQRNNFLPSLIQLRNNKGPLKFKINFYNELANDQGGPSREFFTLLGESLKSQQYKLFRRTPVKNTYYIWVGFYQENGLDLAYAIGLLLACALANKFMIGISFSLPFWKILIGLPIDFQDLRHIIDHQSFKSYEYLKELTNEQLKQLNLTFINPSDGKNLCINGDQIVVDESNLDDYLRLSAHYQIYQPYEKIYQSMKNGFNGQYDVKLLQECFSLTELNKLIDQSDYQIDNAFIQSRIKLGRRGELIKNDIEKYINQLDQNGLRKLIQFVTGSPLFNIHEFKIEIQVDTTMPKNRLPSARTCSQVLVVPNYQNYEVLKQKMDQALEWGLDFFGQN